MNRASRPWAVRAFVTTSMIASLAGAAEHPVWPQARDEGKAIRRVVVGKPPCVFVSTSKRRGTLGVELMDLTPELRTHFGAPEDAGVMVAKVLADSPAAKTGVKVGDIVTGLDGDKISSSREVAAAVRRKARGDVVAIEIRRDGKLTKLSATIEEREKPEIDIGGAFSGDCEEFEFHIDEEAIRDAVEGATRPFLSPEWRARWKSLERLDEDVLEEKLKDLEKRLEELEKEIEKKQKELKKSSGQPI